MHNRNLHDCIHVSIPSSLSFGHLVTEKRVNHRRKYGLKIPAIFHFCGLGKAFKLTKKLKNKITKIGENLKETVRHY